MASSSKKKTTMAKIMREQKVREKRVAKQARKDLRKLEAANPTEHDANDVDLDLDIETADAGDLEPTLQA